MIIQHPDGSYEFRCVPSAASLWLRTLGRRMRTLAERTQHFLPLRAAATCADQAVCTADGRGSR